MQPIKLHIENPAENHEQKGDQNYEAESLQAASFDAEYYGGLGSPSCRGIGESSAEGVIQDFVAPV
jgi:hypothetical protein